MCVTCQAVNRQVHSRRMDLGAGILDQFVGLLPRLLVRLLLVLLRRELLLLDMC